MSVEVANQTGSLGQFASNKGYGDLIAAATKDYPYLRKFLEGGVTEKVPEVIEDLNALAKKADKYVAETARTLASLIDGQEVAVVTDGIEADRLADKEDGGFKKAGGGVMIGWFLPQDIADELALPDGEDPKEMRITLGYFGKELTEEQIAVMGKTLFEISSHYAPLSGSLAGVGRFPASESTENRDVIVHLVDVPRLEGLRERILEDLSGKGVDAFSNHGYTPHVALAYVDPGAEMEMPRGASRPVTVDRLTLIVDLARKDFPLTGQEVLKANPCHNPPGVAGGGQFCSAGSGGALGGQVRNFAGAPGSADSYINDQASVWKLKLLAGEARAVSKYSGEDFPEINGQLRGSGAKTVVVKDRVANLDKAISKNAVPEDTIVYRGLGSHAASLDVLGEGKVFKDKGYVSTTLDPLVSAKFSGGTLMRIRLGKGQSAAPIDDLSHFPKERELLLPRGSKFRITGRGSLTIGGVEFRIIDAEAL